VVASDAAAKGLLGLKRLFGCDNKLQLSHEGAEIKTKNDSAWLKNKKGPLTSGPFYTYRLGITSQSELFLNHLWFVNAIDITL